MQRNRSRRQGDDPSFPRLLGERLCLNFVNTIDGPLSTQPEEYLHSYGDLVRWSRHVGEFDDETAAALLKQGALHGDTAAAVFARALALRHALTGMFQALAHGEAAPQATLNCLREEYLIALNHGLLTPTPSGYAWMWASDSAALDRPLWPVARSAVELLTSGDPARIKECPGAGDCGWLFYDTSKNGSRRWCSMEGCGSRVKMRNQYARAHPEQHS